MLDINRLRERPDEVRDALRKREDDPGRVDRTLALDERRRTLLQDIEALKAELNRGSRETGKLPADQRPAHIETMRGLGDQIKALEPAVEAVERERDALLLEIPNVPAPDVPLGDESHNVVVRQVGEPRAFDFQPQPHWDLMVALGMIDFEAGVKLAGSRFYVLKGWGARLQRAVIQWCLDLHAEQGYTEMYTPFMVREACMWGAGQLPKFRDNLYHDAEEDFWLVPTAEVPLTNIPSGEILDLAQLPIHWCAYTPCFRREKMAAGRDVRGIKRGHQFDKVEMYKFVAPETSYDELERLTADAEETCRRLGLAYRTKLLATGDLGFAATKTYDVEVWAPGQGEWLEVSSCSNVEDYQARRANIRFRREPRARPEFVHTLNGSGLGMPRTVIAIVENGQQADGSIVIPEVLRPYLKTDRITAPTQ
ncbi:MAG: serine--tRNA ligase [Anaerolineae bacterium]|nr:serine--tRNA ligase [Anaerolineae bacterium]